MEAEQFRVTVSQPTGNDNHMDTLFRGLTDYLQKMAHNEDDKFFHIMCHVDANLKAKIEKGEFVAL